jgi:hypothetical protein
MDVLELWRLQTPQALMNLVGKYLFGTAGEVVSVVLQLLSMRTRLAMHVL